MAATEIRVPIVVEGMGEKIAMQGVAIAGLRRRLRAVERHARLPQVGDLWRWGRAPGGRLQAEVVAVTTETVTVRAELSRTRVTFEWQLTGFLEQWTMVGVMRPDGGVMPRVDVPGDPDGGGDPGSYAAGGASYAEAQAGEDARPRAEAAGVDAPAPAAHQPLTDMELRDLVGEASEAHLCGEAMPAYTALMVLRLIGDADTSARALRRIVSEMGARDVL